MRIIEVRPSTKFKGAFKNSRSILFKGLTAGVTYVPELCAIGGSTGQSDWSEPASKMAQ